MEPFSNPDQPSPAIGAKPRAAVPELARSTSTEPSQRENSAPRSQPGISAALAAASAEASAKLAAGNPAVSVRFPGEDGGHSLAEMAQRDLDAALQLLADRAQYITGASGAAIAIRRDGRNDLLCRASAGINAPELGALLSTEFGLSGESVRTRQALRCDDAERDKRVNREVCRQLGIASVVVMPVVNDDEVLGVFELFSGKANAFGARDLSAVQRLSEMVETAVRLAQASENLPERLKKKMNAISALTVEEVEAGKDEAEQVEVEVMPDQFPEGPLAAAVQEESSIAALQALPHPRTSAEISLETSPEIAPELSAKTYPEPSSETAAPKKKLFWSAALSTAADAERAEEPDQSHVPPVLRSLRKCEACGFPVSAGRALCVECEEKKWRGQLKPAQRQSKILSAVAGAAVPRSVPKPDPKPAPKPDPKPEARAFAAAAQSTTSPGAGKTMAAAAASKAPVREATIEPATIAPAAQKLAIPHSVASSDGSAVRSSSVQSSSSHSSSSHSSSAQSSSVQSSTASPKFVLSAGLAPSQSWLAANKYIVGVLLVAAAAVAAIFLLR